MEIQKNKWQLVSAILLFFLSLFIVISGCKVIESETTPLGIVEVTVYDSTQNENLAGADIIIDGILRQEKTPAIISGIESGDHNLTIRPPYLDYPLIDTSFHYTPPETLSIRMQSGKSSNPGTITISTNHDPASVFINQGFRILVTPITINLSSGSHFIAAYKDGFQSLSPVFNLVELRPDDSVSVSFSLGAMQTGVNSGELAPDLELVGDLGDSCSIAQFRGCVLLLNFAGFRCDPCLTELPQIQQVYDRYYTEGFRVLVINVGWWNENSEDFTRIRDELGISIPLLYPGSNGSDATIIYEVIAAPTNILIDRSGIISQRFGATTENDLENRILPLVEN